MLDIKVFGHSFVQHLAHYTVEHKSLDFDLDTERLHVTSGRAEGIS